MRFNRQLKLVKHSSSAFHLSVEIKVTFDYNLTYVAAFDCKRKKKHYSMIQL